MSSSGSSITVFENLVAFCIWLFCFLHLHCYFSTLRKNPLQHSILEIEEKSDEAVKKKSRKKRGNKKAK